MIQQEFINTEKKILEQLETRFNEQKLLTQWQEKENNGLTDILYVEHMGAGGDQKEVLGSYYFLPADTEGPQLHKFLIGISITEELHSWSLELIQEAIAKINFLLPVGAFVIDIKGKTLSYRLGLPFHPEEEPQRMMDVIGYYLVESMQYVSLWMDSLIYLDEGRISYEEFEEYLKTCMTLDDAEKDGHQ